MQSGSITETTQAVVNDRLKYDREVQAEIGKPYSVFAKVYRMVPSGTDVLDVGCHTGKFGAVLKQKGCRVSGLEIDAAAAEQAKARLDAVRVGNVETPGALESFERKFDAILFLDSLEHCQWPGEVLRRARAFLTPQGFLIASMPNVANWSIRTRLLFGKFEYESTGLMDESHLRFYTIKTARELFETAGYTIEAVDHRFSLPVFRLRKFWGGMLAKFLGRLFPGLFSYQIIIKARPRTAPMS